MKKCLNLIFLLGCFALSIATSAEAQTQADFQRIVNNTDCGFVVQAQYGLGCDAAMITTVNILVGPGETEIIAVGTGEVIFNARGFYSIAPGSCRFHVGIDCTGHPLVDDVTCNTACGDYTATLTPGFGVVITN